MYLLVNYSSVGLLGLFGALGLLNWKVLNVFVC